MQTAPHKPSPQLTFDFYLYLYPFFEKTQCLSLRMKEERRGAFKHTKNSSCRYIKKHLTVLAILKGFLFSYYNKYKYTLIIYDEFVRNECPSNTCVLASFCNLLESNSLDCYYLGCFYGSFPGM